MKNIYYTPSVLACYLWYFLERMSDHGADTKINTNSARILLTICTVPRYSALLSRSNAKFDRIRDAILLDQIGIAREAKALELTIAQAYYELLSCRAARIDGITMTLCSRLPESFEYQRSRLGSDEIERFDRWAKWMSRPNNFAGFQLLTQGMI